MATPRSASQSSGPRLGAADVALMDVVRCPDCAASLHERDGTASCDAGHTFRVDNAGIVHLTEKPFYYREVPQTFFEGILAAENDANAIAAFEDALAELDGAQRDYIRNYALDARRGAVAILGDIGPGTVALDFGCGWGNLTRTVARLGGSVVGADMTYESLYFSQRIRRTERQWGVRAGAQLPLPFHDGVFDTVFLNGVLEWLAEGFMLDTGPREVQRRFLSEFHRILKPGGRLVVAIENRHSYAYWKGSPEDHTGLRFGAVLPRPLADRYSRARRGKPYRTFTYTNRGYRRLLRDAGFQGVQVHVPWPRYRNFDQILIGKATRTTVVDPARRGDGARAFVGKRLLRVLQRMSFLEHFAQDFHIVATRPPAPGRSLHGRILAANGETLGDSACITVSSTGSLHFRGDRWFYKVPIDDIAEARLRAETTNVGRLRATPLAPWLVDEASVEELDGLVYGRATRSDGVPTADAAPVLPFLDAAALMAAARPLSETDLWRRTALFAAEIDAVGRASGAASALARLAARRAPSGWLHGDLCAQNVLAHGARCRIVDWDRAEPASPAFLDPLHFAIDGAVKEGVALGDALDAWAAGGGGDVGARARSLLGEITPSEAKLVYLLDRMEKDRDGAGGLERLTARWWAIHGPALAAAVSAVR